MHLRASAIVVAVRQHGEHGAIVRALFADRFAWFDFTEGEGQHKRQFATGGTACVDLLLLRPTLANRTIIASLGAFDGAAGWAKRTLSHPRLVRALRAVRR